MAAVRAALTGGTGVIGRSAVTALLEAGHEVVVVARSPRSAACAESLGATAVPGDVMDRRSLESAFDGVEAVVNLASSIPVGRSAFLPGRWRRDDRILTAGTANVVEAARRTGVRRLVQPSTSSLYADQGDAWITEASPVAINPVNDPSAVAESQVQEYACESRVAVVLRLGQIVGADPQTRHLVRAAAAGRCVGDGNPDGWAHVIHTDDLGSAVLAALHAPSGVYNAGASPVRRRDLAQAYAEVAGVGSVAFRGRMGRWLVGDRLEALSRSVRVCSDHFTAQTGWRPTRPVFDGHWLDAAAGRVLSDVPA